VERVPQFLLHYVKNVNPWGWLVNGDALPRHHVQGTGSVFWVEAGLAVAGAVIVLARRRDDPWWRFVLYGIVVAPIAASLTVGSIQSLRMILWPVLLPLLAIPALEAVGGIRPPGLRAATIVALVAIFAVEAAHFRSVWNREGPKRLDEYEAQVHEVISAAFRHGGTVYASRDVHAAYITTLWDAAVAGRSPSTVVILDPGVEPPHGALVVGQTKDCPSCDVVAVSDGYKAFIAR